VQTGYTLCRSGMIPLQDYTGDPIKSLDYAKEQ